MQQHAPTTLLLSPSFSCPDAMILPCAGRPHLRHASSQWTSTEAAFKLAVISTQQHPCLEDS
eukprot:6415672-Amphidinium_carterae.3